MSVVPLSIVDSLVEKLKGTKTCEFVLTGLGTLLMASLKQYFCTAVTNYPMSSYMGRVFALSVCLFVELPCNKLQLSLCEWFSVVNTSQYHQKL